LSNGENCGASQRICGLDDFLGARGCALAFGAVGLGDGLQVVDVEEEGVVEPPDRRIDVARDRDVDEQRRAVAAPFERAPSSITALPFRSSKTLRASSTATKLIETALDPSPFRCGRAWRPRRRGKICQLANACTVCGDLFNRPLCGFI